MRKSLFKSWRTTLGGFVSLAGAVAAFIPPVAWLSVPLIGAGSAIAGINGADHKVAVPPEKVSK